MLSALDCSSTATRRRFRRRATAGVSKTRGRVLSFFLTLSLPEFVKWVLTFTFVDKILCCDHSNEISLEVLSCDVICFKKIYKMKCGIFVQFAFGLFWQ